MEESNLNIKITKKRKEREKEVDLVEVATKKGKKEEKTDKKKEKTDLEEETEPWDQIGEEEIELLRGKYGDLYSMIKDKETFEKGRKSWSNDALVRAVKHLMFYMDKKGTKARRMTWEFCDSCDTMMTLLMGNQAFAEFRLKWLTGELTSRFKASLEEAIGLSKVGERKDEEIARLQKELAGAIAERDELRGRCSSLEKKKEEKGKSREGEASAFPPPWKKWR